MKIQSELQAESKLYEFLRAYKIQLILALAIFTFGVLGFKYYNYHLDTVAENASFEFSKMTIAVNAKDDTAIKNHGAKLLNKFEKTPYAQFAALRLAKFAVDKQDLDTAVTHLQWILGKVKSGPVYHIAVMRLARIYRSQGNDAKALELLKNSEEDGFASLYNEIKGDLFLDQNKLSKAREFYTKALKSAPKSGATPWLKLKLENISKG